MWLCLCVCVISPSSCILEHQAVHLPFCVCAYVCVCVCVYVCVYVCYFTFIMYSLNRTLGCSLTVVQKPDSISSQKLLPRVIFEEFAFLLEI